MSRIDSNYSQPIDRRRSSYQPQLWRGYGVADLKRDYSAARQGNYEATSRVQLYLRNEGYRNVQVTGRLDESTRLAYHDYVRKAAPESFEPPRKPAPVAEAVQPYSYNSYAAGRAGAFDGVGAIDPGPISGDLQAWIDEAIAILEAAGVPADKIDRKALELIIEKESGGNPKAVNGWDSNAAAGTPSMGLMQTIQSTFNAHALPGHGNILNPVDNIIAGVRYAIARYGSLDNVPGVVSMSHGGSYVGY